MHKEKIDKHILLIVAGGPMMIGNPKRGSIFMYNQGVILSHYYRKVGIISTGFFSANLYFKNFFYKKKERLENLNIFRLYKKLYFIKRFLPFTLLKNQHLKMANQLVDEYIEDHGIPDIIHAHNIFHSGFCSDIISKKYNIPYVITDHSSAFFNYYSKRIITKAKNLITNNSGVYTVSEFNSRLLSEKLNLSVGVIRNIVDKDFETKKPVGLNQSDNYTFLVVARLSKIKNLEMVINCFAKVFKGNDNVNLSIVGMGPQERILRAIIKKENMEGQIQLQGIKSNTYVKESMYKSNCLLMLSKYETFGVVVLEALLCGLPVMSTRVGFSLEAISPLNGLLVDNTKNDISDGLSKIYKNRGKYNRKEIQDDSVKRFGNETFVERITKIYSNLINEK
tara:strand:- start:12849 stop:14030 length:1182 start_codon:yes stop_codon:yes gene_type:complete